MTHETADEEIYAPSRKINSVFAIPFIFDFIPEYQETCKIECRFSTLFNAVQMQIHLAPLAQLRFWPQSACGIVHRRAFSVPLYLYIQPPPSIMALDATLIRTLPLSLGRRWYREACVRLVCVHPPFLSESLFGGFSL